MSLACLLAVGTTAQASPMFMGLGNLPGVGFKSFANGVSADGSVIVGYSFTRNGSAEAFRWTAGRGMVGLGDPSGRNHSLATGVSADGSVIVGYGSTGAFLWDAAHGIRNLQTVLTNDFNLGSSLAGWRLSQATAVSADGRSIVGFGLNPNGQHEAFVASLEPAASAPAVPEPSSFVLLGIGAVCLIGSRRKRRRIVRRA